MDLSGKALALRLTFWCAIFAWAVWKIHNNADIAAGAAIAVAPEMRSLVRPPNTRVPAEKHGIIDIEAVLEGMAAAKSAAAGCEAHGATLHVTVGTHGLEHAELDGQIADPAAACLTAAIWQLPWPAGDGEMEADKPL